MKYSPQQIANRNNANAKLLIKGAAFAAFASRVLGAMVTRIDKTH